MTSDQMPAEPQLGGPPPVPMANTPNDAGAANDKARRNPLSWLICLYVRPERFFSIYAKSTSMFAIVLCVEPLAKPPEVRQTVHR